MFALRTLSSLDLSCAILFWQSARRISASASFILSTSYKWKIVSVANESKYLFELSLKDWLREKESNLHLRVQSPTCCQLHHPARCYRVSGHWDSNPEPRADLALKPLIRRLLFQLSYAP